MSFLEITFGPFDSPILGWPDVTPERSNCLRLEDAVYAFGWDRNRIQFERGYENGQVKTRVKVILFSWR